MCTGGYSIIDFGDIEVTIQGDEGVVEVSEEIVMKMRTNDKPIIITGVTVNVNSTTVKILPSFASHKIIAGVDAISDGSFIISVTGDNSVKFATA